MTKTDFNDNDLGHYTTINNNNQSNNNNNNNNISNFSVKTHTDNNSDSNNFYIPILDDNKIDILESPTLPSHSTDVKPDDIYNQENNQAYSLTTFIDKDGAEKNSFKAKGKRCCHIIEDDTLGSETDQTVLIPQDEGFTFKKLKTYLGPAIFVSIGYMDPGNWATDLQAGSEFGYKLLWVLLLSNVMALLLQYLSFKIALVTKKDLASVCRSQFPRGARIILWIICEVAITATDLAEVIGSAVGLQILFGIPLIAGVIITALDTLLFLAIQRFGIRKLEMIVLCLMVIITLCFVVELFFVRPEAEEVIKGLFIPTLSSKSVVVATGIIGAVVMPHNLFLHSGVVNSRSVGENRKSIAEAIKYNIVDTIIALNGAFFVNSCILMLAAAVFYTNHVEVNELQDAYRLLGDMVGKKAASILFGIGLLCAGQASTITGTMAGQIVMEGFVELKISPWIRRLVTRLMAIIPAVIVISISGEQMTYDLLIFSQVVLSLALPFAIVPLIQFTSDKEIMGGFKNSKWVIIASWLIVLFMISLNLMTVIEIVGSLLNQSTVSTVLTIVFILPLCAFLVLFLIWILVNKSIGHLLRRFV